MFKTLSTMTLLGLLTLSAARAQSEQPIRAKVPFAFTVQNTRLPAGNYQLTYSTIAHILSIQGLDQSSRGAFATAEPTTTASEASGGPGKLVFDCYGKTCYLWQVWQGRVRSDRGLKVLHTGREHALSIATRVVSVTIPAK
jgi:hypothetical protein